MNKIAFIFLALMISACASSKPIYLTDGTEGYAIDCSGSANNWGNCLEEAGKLCGAAGYERIDQASDKGVMVSGNQFGVYGGSTISRTMVIRCKR